MLVLAARQERAARLVVLGGDTPVIHAVCVVTLASPAFNQDFGFLQGIEDPLVQQFSSILPLNDSM